jgi:hypothetical protein
LPAGYNKIALPVGHVITSETQGILDSLGLEVNQDSPIQVIFQDIDDGDFQIQDNTKIHIVIPTATPVAE